MKHGMHSIISQLKASSAFSRFPGAKAWLRYILPALLLVIFVSSVFTPQISAGDGDSQIEDLPPIPQPEKKHPKLDRALADKAEKAQSQKPLGPSKFTPQTIEPPVEKVKVVVEVEGGKKETAVNAIKAAGGQVETTYDNLVQAMVPVTALTALADSPAARRVRRPATPVMDIVTSQGVSVIGSSIWGDANIKGQGVKIAVLDGGFQGYASLLGTELPNTVTIKSFRADQSIEASSKHGTGIAEIIYDIAPAAQMYLVNFGTEVEWGNAVDWLIAQNVNIISHSVGWVGWGTGDGGGPANAVVSKATNAGILWVNAAGNSAQQHWGGTWVDNDNDTFLNFSPTDNGQTFSASAGGTIRAVLTWDDPWGVAANDYDLYLASSSTNTVVASSTYRQSLDGIPEEEIYYVVPTSGTYSLWIKKYASNKSSKFNLFNLNHGLQYVVASGSIASPADSSVALSVGAVAWNTPDSLETFSSQGPTTDGRIKPDIVAPDGVSTVAYSPNPFYGTSASAPHVSAAAALVKQANPTWNPTQIKSFLESRAIELGTAGKDNQFGSGRLNLGAIPDLWISSVTLSSPTTKSVPTLSWPAASGVAFYEVRMDGGSWTNVGNVLTYTGTALSNSNHTFDVRASDGAGNSGVPASVAFAIDALPAADKDIVVEVASSINQPGVQKAVAGPNRVAPTIVANVGDTIMFKPVRGTATGANSSNLNTSLSIGSATGVTTEASGMRFTTTVDTYPSAALVAGNGDFSPGSAVSITVNGSPVTTVPANPAVGTGAAGDAGTGKFAPVSITVPSLKRATASNPHILKLSDGVTEITANLIINPRAQFTPEIGGNGQTITVTGTGFRSSSSIDIEVRAGILLGNGTGVATGAPLTLTFPFDNTLNASHAIQVTTPGTFILTLPPGTSGTVTSGTATVTGSPVTLAAGANTITSTTVGTFVVDYNAAMTPTLTVSQGVLITNANGSFTGTFAAPDIMAAASPANTINAMDGGAARANATGLVSGGRFFVLDNIPPTAPTGLNATPSATSVALTWSANTEVDIAGYKVYYDTKAGPPFQGTGATQGNSPITVGTVATFTLSGLNTGVTLHLALTAYDTHGNESDYSQGKQVTPVAAPSNLSKTTPDNDNTPTFTWSAVSGAASYQVSMDGGAYANIGNVLTYTTASNLSDGSHNFYARAVDGSGNAGPAANLSFTIDTVPPTTPTNLSKTTPDKNNTPSFTWTASTDALSGVDHYEVQLDLGAWTAIGNVTTYTWPSAIPDGSHTVNLRALDKATNVSTITSLTFTIDSTQPTTPSNLTRTTSDYNTKPAFTWSASTDATSGVDYYEIKLDSGSWTNIGNVTGYTWPGSMSYGSHNVNVRAVDKAGNVGNSTNISFNILPNQAPVAVISAPQNGNSFFITDNINFNGSQSSDSDGDTLTYEWSSSKDGILGATATLTKQLTSGSHTISLKVSDGKGGQNTASITITVKTQKALDVTWGSHNTPTAIKPGQMVGVAVSLTNTGTQTWLKGGANPVYVTYHWYNASWQPVEWGTGLRSSFSQDVAAGQTIDITASLKAPPTPGTYNLLYDVVQEGITWFSGQGAQLLAVNNITIAATQTRDVQWVSHNTPASIKPGQIASVPISLTNTGSQTWPKGGANPVYVTYHWYNASWQPVEWGIGLRSALSQDIASGQVVNLTASLKAPSAAGTYNLIWDVVQEGVAWFSGQGAPILGVSNISVAASQAKDLQWVSQNTPTTIKPGQMVGVPIMLTNTGSQTWPKGGTNPVYVTYHWYNASWQPVEWGIGLRSSFPNDVASGQVVNLTASLKAPSAAGTYNLIWDVVQEGVAWFSGQGAPILGVSSITVTAAQAKDLQWVSQSTPTNIKPGQMVGIPIMLTNTGSQTWPKGGANPVYVTYHWYNASWQPVEWGIGLRSSFPNDMASGQMVSLTASLKAPSTAGTYNLIWDVVQENVAWFSGQGAPLLGVNDVAIAATQANDVQWVSHNTPNSLAIGQQVNVTITLTNTGSEAWLKEGANPINLSYHWLTSSGQLAVWDGMATALVNNIASGQMVTLTAALKAPSVAGSYYLAWDLVKMGVGWFSGQGAALLYTPIITIQ